MRRTHRRNHHRRRRRRYLYGIVALVVLALAAFTLAAIYAVPGAHP